MHRNEMVDYFYKEQILVTNGTPSKQLFCPGLSSDGVNVP